jgi:hypothetical protein
MRQATNARNRRLEPAYKQHAAVDDKAGVILDVEVTTGQTNEGEMIEARVDEVASTTGIDIKTVTAHAGYAYAKVCGALERGRHRCDDPSQGRADQEPHTAQALPLRRQARHLEMPARAHLRPARPIKHGRFFYSKG